jgi:hypothetical protein
MTLPSSGESEESVLLMISVVPPRRRTALLGTLVALILVWALGIGSARSATATRTLGFGGYGAARVGDTPAEVRRHLGEPLECHSLAGSCVCASLGEYPTSVTFVYRLDRQSGLDVIFTSSREVVVARGLHVGDSIGRMRSLYPHTHETGHVGYSGYKRFLVSRGALGILAEVQRGRITGFIVGKKRFFNYEEFCA